MKQKDITIILFFLILIQINTLPNLFLVDDTLKSVRYDGNSRNDYNIVDSVKNGIILPPERPILSFPRFPDSIEYQIDIVFIGINQSDVNETLLVELLPTVSQISRYVPLSYTWETYINYSIRYRYVFMEQSFSNYLANAISSLGNWPFTLDITSYWVNRTTIGEYSRLDPDSTGSRIETTINDYKTQDGANPAIRTYRPTIFLSNLFFDNSKFYQNTTPVPHFYWLETRDLDTNMVSGFRQEAGFSPGFDWKDNPWLYLDLSSGPSVYESISSEYVNYIDYMLGATSLTQSGTEIGRIIRSSVFSRFLPTYLYEPMYDENVEFRIALFKDESFPALDYLNLNKISSVFNDLLPFSNINIDFVEINCSVGSLVYDYLDYIAEFSNYPSYASKLIDFLIQEEETIFGSVSPNNGLDYLVGVFATDLVDGHDQSLGFTHAYLGSSHARGSVVTIPSSSILSEREGLTQTTIHEIGHMLSLRHPHDYRFNDQFFNFWTWDVCSTPLSYFYSTYEWNKMDTDILFRGQFRYLFNSTSHIYDTINSTLFSKNFPIKNPPDYIYYRLDEVLRLTRLSLNDFIYGEYYQALEGITASFNELTSIYKNISTFSNYFEPLVDFYIENNSVYDFGDPVEISGSVVSFHNSTGYLTGSNRTDELNITSTKIHQYLYESEFYILIQSNNYVLEDDIFPFTIFIYDGVQWSSRVLELTFRSLKINIVSPSNQMSIDLSYSDSLKIVGSYFSISNTSNIKIIYGSFWYVHDFEDNDSSWFNVNKTSGNEWIFYTNYSFFINGKNIIKTKISNGISTDIKSLEIFLSGLPVSIDDSSELTDSDTSPFTSGTGPLTNPPFIGARDILVYSTVITTVGFLGLKGYKSYSKSRMLKKLENRKDIPSPFRRDKTMSEIKQSIKKISEKIGREESKPVVKPRRRRK